MTTLHVADFGAIGDGIQDDTEAFELAIQEIAKNGGGRLVVAGCPPGHENKERIYKIRPINLTSHMELYVEAGAVLQGLANASLWPIIPALPSYGQGRDHPGPRHTSLLHGESLVNVTLRGQDSRRSVIDGQGWYWWQRFQNKTEQYTRGSLIEFLYSSQVAIYNLQLRNSPFWTIHPFDCDDVRIRQVHVRNPRHAPNTDGFDPDSSRHVWIEDSSYDGGDDCVAIKSGWDCFGIQYGKPCTHIHLRNVTCWAGQIALGSEVSGGIEHVWGDQIYFPGQAWHAVKVKSGESRGGYIRNVTFQNIHVTGNLQSSVLNIDTTLYSSRTGKNPSCPDNWMPPTPTLVQEFRFENWYGMSSNVSGTTMFVLRGMSVQNPIRQVLLRNLYFPDPSGNTTTASWICENVTAVTAWNGTITPWPPCHAVKVVNLMREDRQSAAAMILPFWPLDYTNGSNQAFSIHSLQGLCLIFALLMLSIKCCQRSESQKLPS